VTAAADYVVMLTTLPDMESARRLARTLVEEKLAACVQLSLIESFYRWDGKIANEPEVLLLIKTRTELFDAAIARIKALHPYTVPEIVATPFTAGFPPYLEWIGENTG
jgi:periplasmic divalent cation tolerance protein